jgi:putative phage-type endonuclease
MKFWDVEQGSSEWFELRKGIPTASRFDMILTPAQGKPSKSQDKLIAELIGEKLSIIPPEGVENFTNRAMRWGQQCEHEARLWYEMERGLPVTNGGFCATDDERFGASPDGLVNAEGCLELKAPQASTQVEYVLAGTLPDEYKWQCHGHLVVTGRKWVDFLSYSPGLPCLLIRVEPNADTDKLRAELEAFHGKYLAALKKIKGE